MKRILIYVCISLVLAGCADYLDIKPDQKLATISSKDDIWALLNNENVLNTMPMVGEDMSDNYHVRSVNWNAITNEANRNKYIWANTEQDDIAWSVLYHRVYYTNVVLEAVQNIRNTLSDAEANQMVGTALFYRSMSFFELLNIYSLPYTIDGDGEHLGIPLRTTADINATFPRSSVMQSYRKVIADLLEATDLLPSLSNILTRPTKMASQALLARIYLAIGDFDNAMKYSKMVLDVKSDLLDYGTLDADLATPFTLFNREVIHHTSSYSQLLTQSNGLVDSVLYGSYTEDDWRKQLFFEKNGDGTFFFKGSYVQDLNNHFTGISVPELYLIFIEAAIRTDHTAEGRERLRDLMSHRYREVPENLIGQPEEGLLEFVLSERRKELIFRNRRWEDIRRLNLGGENIIIRRKLGDNMHTLDPDSKRYAVLIPMEAIEYGGIDQN